MPGSFVHGKGAVFSIDDGGGALRDVTIDLTGVTGLPGARALSSVTAFGAQGEQSLPALANVTFSIAGFFDVTATVGIATVLNGIRLATVTSTFAYGPAGSATGALKITGECWMTAYTIDASVSAVVPIAATFQVEGVPTLTTY